MNFQRYTMLGPSVHLQRTSAVVSKWTKPLGRKHSYSILYCTVFWAYSHVWLIQTDPLTSLEHNSNSFASARCTNSRKMATFSVVLPSFGDFDPKLSTTHLISRSFGQFPEVRCICARLKCHLIIRLNVLCCRRPHRIVRMPIFFILLTNLSCALCLLRSRPHTRRISISRVYMTR